MQRAAPRAPVGPSEEPEPWTQPWSPPAGAAAAAPAPPWHKPRAPVREVLLPRAARGARVAGPGPEPAGVAGAAAGESLGEAEAGEAGGDFLIESDAEAAAAIAKAIALPPGALAPGSRLHIPGAGFGEYLEFVPRKMRGDRHVIRLDSLRQPVEVRASKVAGTWADFVVTPTGGERGLLLRQASSTQCHKTLSLLIPHNLS